MDISKEMCALMERLLDEEADKTDVIIIPREFMAIPDTPFYSASRVLLWSKFEKMIIDSGATFSRVFGGHTEVQLEVFMEMYKSSRDGKLAYLMLLTQEDAAKVFPTLPDLPEGHIAYKLIAEIINCFAQDGGPETLELLGIYDIVSEHELQMVRLKMKYYNPESEESPCLVQLLVRVNIIK
jgi:hypothetical protein